MVQVGKVSLNPEAFKDYPKEQFFDEYKGKLDVDKEVVWKQIEAINKKKTVVLPTELGEILGLKKVSDEGTGSTGKQSKRNKRK